MRFTKVFVFLAFLGSSVWAQNAQTLSVLGEDPIDISSIPEGENLQLGLINNTPSTLTLTFSFELQEPNKTVPALDGRTLSGNGSQNYFSIPITQGVRGSMTPGYLVINAVSDSPTTNIRIERQLVNPKPASSFKNVQGVAWLALVLAVCAIGLAFIPSRSCKNPGRKFWTGWLAGTPQVSFTESIGSVSAILLASSNSGLIPSVTGLVAPETKSLQILGLIFLIPILLAPLILRVTMRRASSKDVLCSTKKSGDTPEVIEDKVNISWYTVASFISLTGTLLQVYVLYEWLKLLDLSFLPVLIDWAVAISIVFAIFISALGFATVRSALCNLRLCRNKENENVSNEQERTVAVLMSTFSDDLQAKLQAGIEEGKINIVQPNSQSSTRKLRNILF